MLPCPGVATSLIFSAAPLESVLRAQGCLVQTDSLLSRLKALKERIDATEAHVTLDLDHRRNQIVSFNLVSSVTSLTGASPLREILTIQDLRDTQLYAIQLRLLWPRMRVQIQCKWALLRLSVLEVATSCLKVPFGCRWSQSPQSALLGCP